MKYVLLFYININGLKVSTLKNIFHMNAYTRTIKKRFLRIIALSLMYEVRIYTFQTGRYSNTYTYTHKHESMFVAVQHWHAHKDTSPANTDSKAIS